MLILLGLILAAALLVAFGVYRVTGPMGIEERYSHAVGLPSPEEEPGGGWLGFSVEGDPLLYAVILVILGGICLLTYLRWRREESW
jgi:uncharacterized membrane protein YphA (DoxX/SURF4 family)